MISQLWNDFVDGLTILFNPINNWLDTQWLTLSPLDRRIYKRYYDTVLTIAFGILIFILLPLAIASLWNSPFCGIVTWFLFALFVHVVGSEMKKEESKDRE